MPLTVASARRRFMRRARPGGGWRWRTRIHRKARIIAAWARAGKTHSLAASPADERVPLRRREIFALQVLHPSCAENIIADFTEPPVRNSHLWPTRHKLASAPVSRPRPAPI